MGTLKSLTEKSFGQARGKQILSWGQTLLECPWQGPKYALSFNPIQNRKVKQTRVSINQNWIPLCMLVIQIEDVFSFIYLGFSHETCWKFCRWGRELADVTPGFELVLWALPGLSSEQPHCSVSIFSFHHCAQVFFYLTTLCWHHSFSTPSTGVSNSLLEHFILSQLL